MWVALEEGLNAAINHSLRRVTICLDGLRSHNLPWESAEKVAVATAHHVVKNLLTDASLTEIVIVTSLSQQKWLLLTLSSVLIFKGKKAFQKSAKHVNRRMTIMPYGQLFWFIRL
ncbi:hypothetical protein ILYODFUR_037143 [Ilyodon furcidens]|uniref:Uncharacterized protein n=1 Tax=Ilyodon furcidens TaxID=33524 RepID=A0ABV0V994_9TELE